MEHKIKIAITHGDINGIGYETILKVLEDPRIAEICTPIIYGSAKIAAFYRKQLELPDVHLVTVDSPEQATGDSNYIINVVPEEVHPAPGAGTPESGAAALAALERATADMRDGLVDALVTCPISKDAIHSDDFSFPGHTEYLQDRFADAGDPSRAMMIMAAGELRVALLTIHESLADVTPLVTAEAVTDALKRFNEALVSDFSLHAPRIAVLALDPHAGDGGVIGTADRDIIAPAVAQACAQGVLAFGPYPADGLFGSGGYRKFDGILAMYHDQGLIPFKLLMGEQGVNCTAGLECVRTSPDHGTAFDIAGKGVADASSLRQAIYTAIDIYRSRRNHREATANPLRKQNFDRGRRDS